MGIEDKKVAVLLARGFEDHEFSEPVKALKDAHVHVTVVGLDEKDKAGVEGKHGTVARADRTIDEVDFDDFDLLLVPGGKGPAILRKDRRVLDFVKRFDSQDKPIAAICHGPQVLVSADILKGRNATSYFTVAREVKKAGAHFTSKPVIVDKNLITSRQVGDIPQFIDAVFTMLEQLDEQERKTA